MRRSDSLAMRYVDGEMSGPWLMAYRARLLLSPQRRAEVAQWRALSTALRTLRDPGKKGLGETRPTKA